MSFHVPSRHGVFATKAAQTWRRCNDDDDDDGEDDEDDDDASAIQRRLQTSFFAEKESRRIW